MPAISLTQSTWRFREDRRQGWLPATVPGCVHTDLFRAGRIPDPFFGSNELTLRWIEERDWEYQTTFNVPPPIFSQEVIELVADGLDTVATVTVNGHEIGRTANMFVGYRWDVKRHLRPKNNVLRIRFGSAMTYIRTANTDFSPPREINDPVGGCVRIRKQQCQFGWDWGPRFVTAGIWRDIRLEGWTVNRLSDVKIVQQHRRGEVTLQITPAFVHSAPAAQCTVVLRRGEHEVTRASFSTAVLELNVPAPALWWPAGQGEQPLYDVVIAATDSGGNPLGQLHRRIGLRTIELDRSADRWGESFQFVVNGRPVFLKGANWIPAHAFVAGLTRADYARDLSAAAAANMNALRVWGGGIYESEDFYDLCDELGLLVWQDFMFACTLYPANRAFLDNVRAEAEFQVKRLRHRACLALWCGNNELVMLNPTLREQPELQVGYHKLFHELLPAVAASEGATDYWPTSPWRGNLEKKSHEEGEKAGDSHFWDVWHARRPVKDYEKWAFRFVSEFGMQSYSSTATNATFCPSDDANVFGPSMENHQKNRGGNQVILDYVSRRYRFPRGQPGLIYLSQLNQAYCMQVGVEHYRRLMPRCMGALYWQLNDCWPVASWSSLEFTGHWKALHHAARRFFAPQLVSIHVPGDETITIGNYRASTVTTAHLYIVSDAPVAAAGILRWELRLLSGRRVLVGSKKVQLRPSTSVKQRTIELEAVLRKIPRDQLYLRASLSVGRRVVSEQTAFLCAPRFLALPRGAPAITGTAIGPCQVDLTFRSPVFLHAVAIEIPGTEHETSDNFFDLYPNVPRTVRITLTRPIPVSGLLKRLQTQSLVDSYS